MLNSSNQMPTAQTSVYPRHSRGSVLVSYVATVSVLPFFEQKQFFIKNAEDPKMAFDRATAWCKSKGAEMVKQAVGMMDKAHVARIAQDEAEAAERAKRRILHLQRIETAAKGVRAARRYFGEGRPGYYTGYVNAFGSYTDGDL